MALFRAQVNYHRGTNEKWSNVYHCDAASMLVAEAAWQSTGVPDLQPLLDSTCSISTVLLSDPAGPSFVTIPINVGGSKTTSGDLLPLYNTAKVLIPTPGFGRPDIKYLKGNVAEGDQTAGVLTTTATGEIDTRFTTLITDMAAAGAALVSDTGEAYSNCSVQPAVQMRQMHRKRRKTTP